MTFYGTVAGSDTYFSTQKLDPNDDWKNQDPAKKTIALQQATNIIDRLAYAGDKYDSDQELEFPRFTDTTVPTPVTYACYEIAYALLVQGRDPDLELESANIISENQGAGATRKDITRTPVHILHGVPSPSAYRLLTPYFKDSRTITLSRID